ncbi:MAG TPA: Sir2 family NAD-dependent protein deacetylase [Thermoanaerobaculales bacterium]|nr:Sir2 family NAD-dependent protein deacetylase [Thermoanaerobaculales bacterium]HPA80109.1 Sir2 family NAD-dependent protein deacetylase [Thermoanaerobaculales bacterium]HQL29261.1 Sir2 family NAD-dependent protein deacetylase [Thermoanaerobaculales bacterium]
MRQEISAAGCAERIRSARRVVALTGAGISTAAGVPDFRGPGGIYTTGRYDPQATFEIDGFLRDPAPFFRFTRDVLGLVADLEPTLTHRFLVGLEAAGTLRTVITQNIDPLHQRAGSRGVIAVHGGYWTSHCLACRGRFSLDELLGLLERSPVPFCSCGGVVKPDVVLFGEPVYAMEEAVAAVAAADLLLVLGSSLAVYPAAWLPEVAECPVVVVNRGPVELAAAPDRFFADAELDPFFSEVARELGMAIPEPD